MVETFRDPKLSFLYESAEYAQIQQQKKKKKKTETEAPFGWNVFNDNTLYRAYNKRINKISKNIGFINDTKKLSNVNLFNNDNDEITEENIDNMVNELNEQISKRKKFQRRRTYYQDADVSYINKRNMVFNKKVERAYGKYTTQIRMNLERGTAL